jgi:hypothetical protein
LGKHLQKVLDAELTLASDYATWTNLQDNITSTAPLCNYAMVRYVTAIT